MAPRPWQSNIRSPWKALCGRCWVVGPGLGPDALSPGPHTPAGPAPAAQVGPSQRQTQERSVDTLGQAE